MRPLNLQSRIFLDSGNPEDTREALSLLGFLDGQTTNPSLVAKNPEVAARKSRGELFSREELLREYRSIVEEISGLIPQGSVSIEVEANFNSTAEDLYLEGKEMNTWISNAHIKYPTITAGLRAAEQSVRDGMRVNMTLVFSLQQAAAVYAATRGAKKGDVFLSPFVGRLDDTGVRGLDFITNVLHLYRNSDHHVEVLAASVRTIEHFMACLTFGVDIITAPIAVLRDWAALGLPVNEDTPVIASQLTPIQYEEVSLDLPLQDYMIQHDLTDAGVKQFVSDWQKLLE